MNTVPKKRKIEFVGASILEKPIVKNGDKASEEIKYYLQDTFGKANSSNVNAHASSLNVATYTFSSDTEGNILMNGSVILKKSEGVEKLSGTAKEIDDYTKVVTNLVN